MDFYEQNCIKKCQKILMHAGLWPFDYSRRKTVQRICFCAIQISFICAQIFVYFTTEINLRLLSITIPVIMICMIVMLKYGTIWARNDKYKQLFEHMIADWYNLKDVEEINALRRGYSEASFYNMLLFLFSYTFTFSTISLQTLPRIAGRISHLNRTIARTLPIITEYFVDSDEYVYPILIHVDLSVLLASFMQISSDILNVTIMMHISGMFEVIGLFEKCEACIYDAVVVELLFGTLSMTGILLAVYNMKSMVPSLHVIIASFLMIFTYSSIIYVTLLPAERIWQSSEDLFFKAYTGKWYTAPVEFQRILLFLIQRFMTPCKIEFKAFVPAGNELYVKVVRYGFSYFMVLYSFQE